MFSRIKKFIQKRKGQKPSLSLSDIIQIIIEHNKKRLELVAKTCAYNECSQILSAYLPKDDLNRDCYCNLRCKIWARQKQSKPCSAIVQLCEAIISILGIAIVILFVVSGIAVLFGLFLLFNFAQNLSLRTLLTIIIVLLFLILACIYSNGQSRKNDSNDY